VRKRAEHHYRGHGTTQRPGSKGDAMTMTTRHAATQGETTQHEAAQNDGTPDVSERYDTDRYHSAVGLNWYDADPTLQFLMRAYFDDDALAWAVPHMERLGALMGGPVAEWAVEIDRK